MEVLVNETILRRQVSHSSMKISIIWTKVKCPSFLSMFECQGSKMCT